MRKLFLILALVGWAGLVSGQNLLGYSPKDVSEYFRVNDPAMVLAKNFKNDKYKYLKFTDEQNDLRTILVFMTEKDKCKSVKAMYDLSLEKEVLDHLNKNYTKSETNIWIDNSRRRKARINYSKDEWFLTILYTPKK